MSETREKTAPVKTDPDRDRNDLGVPMLKGSSDEPTGPEDALGRGPKRGDYTDRVGPSNYHPHESRSVDGVTVVEAQRPRVADRGDVKGKKGGVDSAPSDD